MDSIYLSPAQARLPLSTERDVVAALEDGLLEESHFLDFKREVKAGKAQNKETARDLAQFAIDGGTVLVGIDELGDGTLDRRPQLLDGLAERIEQIATTNVDPPLAVTARAIPTDADRTVGYLVVHVPASPVAPHMVENRYVARGDKTKRYLTDPEVLRLHAMRSVGELDALRLLQEEIQRDVFADGPVGNAHGFFVAQPMAGRAEMLLGLTDGPDYQGLLDLTQAALRRSQVIVGTVSRGGFSPDLSDFTTYDRRPAGVAQSSHGIGPGRRIREGDGYTNRETAGELELLDNGGVRIYTARLSYPDQEQTRLLIDSAVVGLAHRLVAIAQGVADQSGYFGSWALAFGATKTRGTYSSLIAQRWDSTSSPYPDESYERATAATYADLTQRPRELVDQLVGGFLRGFGTRKAFLPALATPLETEA